MLHLFERIEIVSTRIHTGNIIKCSNMLQHIQRLRLNILRTGSTLYYNNIYYLLHASVNISHGFAQCIARSLQTSLLPPPIKIDI